MLEGWEIEIKWKKETYGEVGIKERDVGRGKWGFSVSGNVEGGRLGMKIRGFWKREAEVAEGSEAQLEEEASGKGWN